MYKTEFLQYIATTVKYWNIWHLLLESTLLQIFGEFQVWEIVDIPLCSVQNLPCSVYFMSVAFIWFRVLSEFLSPKCSAAKEFGKHYSKQITCITFEVFVNYNVTFPSILSTAKDFFCVSVWSV